MASSRPRMPAKIENGDDTPWLWIAVGAGLVLAGGAYFLLSSGTKSAEDTSKPASKPSTTSARRPQKAVKTPKPTPVASASEGSAAAPTSDPEPSAPVDASASATSASASTASAVAVTSSEPVESEADAARRETLQALTSELSDAQITMEIDSDGAVTKESLLVLLKDLTRRILIKRGELQDAINSGELSMSQFESELGAAIPKIEKEVNEEYGVEADPVFKAQTKYQEDEDIVAVSRDLRNAALPDFAAKAMGEIEGIVGSPGTVPDGMTAARVAQLTRDNATETIGKMRELVSEIKASGKTGREALDAFQVTFIERAKALTTETFASLGITADDYAASMMKFMETPDVQMAQAESQQRLMVCQQVNMMELTTGMSREDAIASMGIPAELGAML